MRTIVSVMFVLLLMATVGCQSDSQMMERDTSSVVTQQDVVNAWNRNCDTFDFESITLPNILVMEGVYSGSDFATDSDNFMQAMQADLMVSVFSDPDLDDLVSAVIDDEVWYQ